MFVYSFKASRVKALALLLLSAAVIVTSAVFISGRDGELPQAVSASAGKIRFDGIKTEEDLLAFINTLGIEVKTPAYRSIDVELPRVFDAVYAKYNEVQKQQGLDLTKYRGRTLHRYTFEVTNYPSGEENEKVYLTLFVHKNKVVGGDISSRGNGGFVRTFVDFSRNDGSVG